MENRTRTANPPLWRESLTGIDWLSLRLSPIYRGQRVTRGDGSPVIVVPGCFARDESLRELHSWLSRVGYRAYYSGIGLNVRCPEISVETLVQTIDQAFEETGRSVTLVGHSLGGLLARGAAALRADKVARVITLGSPVNGIVAHPLVMGLADLFHGDCKRDCLGPLQAELPAGISETCVYSKTDGVVDWRTCHRPDARNIEVRGTHCGLIFNANVYGVIANALTPPRPTSDVILGWEHSLVPTA
jgi:pimeloyl-ACP methyl ester carboxylesterase